jgi:putative Mn2+ efflux pump MntP
MTLFSILLIAIALSFDAMAVSAANGAHDNKMSFTCAFRVAFFFGIFHFVMPLIGWLIGTNFKQVISSFDHIIAFLLLSVLGLKMILESFKSAKEKNFNIKSLKIILLMSLAISIDALVVGMTFALLPVNIWLAISIIGATAFSLSLGSVYIGKVFGKQWGNKAEIIGGLILIVIGIKILIDHLLI